MGRNMFGGEGEWGDDPWDGWWETIRPSTCRSSSSPTTNARRSSRTEARPSPSSRTASNPPRAGRKAADGKDVAVSGGASIAQQYLRAGLLDEIRLHVVPVLLGDGARLFDNLGGAEVKLESTRTVEAPASPTSPTAS